MKTILSLKAPIPQHFKPFTLDKKQKSKEQFGGCFFYFSISNLYSRLSMMGYCFSP